jgi:hypothetical protein
VLGRGLSRPRIQVDCRSHEQRCSGKRKQGTTSSGTRPHCEREPEKGSSNQADRNVDGQGPWKTGRGKPADGASQRVVTGGQPPGDEHSRSRDQRREHPKSRGDQSCSPSVYGGHPLQPSVCQSGGGLHGY